MCSKRHPVVLMPASTPLTSSRCISLLLRTLCLCILQSLGVPTLLLNLIQKNCSVKLHVMLLYFLHVCCAMLHLACCMIFQHFRALRSPQEPSGAPSQGQSVQQRKDALPLQGQNLSFISFIHQMWHCMHRIICIYLCVLMWRAEPQASNVDHYEEDSVGDISVRLCPPKSNAVSCIFWDGKSSPRC